MKIREIVANLFDRLRRKKLPEAIETNKECTIAEEMSAETQNSSNPFAESLREDNSTAKSYEERLIELIKKYQETDVSTQDEHRDEKKEQNDILKTIVGAVLERKGVQRLRIEKWINDLTTIEAIQPIMWPMTFASGCRDARRPTNSHSSYK